MVLHTNLQRDNLLGANGQRLLQLGEHFVSWIARVPECVPRCKACCDFWEGWAAFSRQRLPKAAARGICPVDRRVQRWTRPICIELTITNTTTW